MDHDTLPGEAANAVLIAREDLTDALSIVRVRPDGGVVPAFVPGQFIRLGLPKAEAAAVAGGPVPGTVMQSLPAGATGEMAPVAERPHVRPRRPGRIRYTRRAYSIASSPKDMDALEFFVVRIEEGALTPRLWELQLGERLWMDCEAKGEFRLDEVPGDKNLVMISSGTGIAPFVSLLRTWRGQSRWRRLILVNGVRYAADLGYREELEQAAHADATIRYIPLVTREPATSAWPGLRGRVQTALAPAVFQELAGVPLDPQTCDVYLCGNPEMIDSVAALLQGSGFKLDSREGRGNVHFERYW